MYKIVYLSYNQKLRREDTGRTVEGSYATFIEAFATLKKKPCMTDYGVYRIEDEDKLLYFSDGSGTGFKKNPKLLPHTASRGNYATP